MVTPEAPPQADGFTKALPACPRTSDLPPRCPVRCSVYVLSKGARNGHWRANRSANGWFACHVSRRPAPAGALGLSQDRRRGGIGRPSPRGPRPACILGQDKTSKRLRRASPCAQEVKIQELKTVCPSPPLRRLTLDATARVARETGPILDARTDSHGRS